MNLVDSCPEEFRRSVVENWIQSALQDGTAADDSLA